uniref:Uncharacterized protein n=1 Tax=Anopheles farauti TaxID=69004 RepID=A0A182QG66_9DIPT
MAQSLLHHRTLHRTPSNLPPKAFSCAVVTGGGRDSIVSIPCGLLVAELAECVVDDVCDTAVWCGGPGGLAGPPPPPGCEPCCCPGGPPPPCCCWCWAAFISVMECSAASGGPRKLSCSLVRPGATERTSARFFPPMFGASTSPTTAHFRRFGATLRTEATAPVQSPVDRARTTRSTTVRQNVDLVFVLVRRHLLLLTTTTTPVRSELRAEFVTVTASVRTFRTTVVPRGTEVKVNRTAAGSAGPEVGAGGGGGGGVLRKVQKGTGDGRGCTTEHGMMAGRRWIVRGRRRRRRRWIAEAEIAAEAKSMRSEQTR